jgi:hypothetical protein
MGSAGVIFGLINSLTPDFIKAVGVERWGQDEKREPKLPFGWRYWWQGQP